jgi:hypothetical protein
MSVVSDFPGRSGEPGGAQVPEKASSAGPLRRLRERWLEATLLSYPPRDKWPAPIRRARIGGFIVLGIQLILLGWWSSVLVSRFALTKDFGAYQQAAYLIGHGNLNPYSSVLLQQFWRNDTELIIWPLAIFARIWPHLTALPWLQDLALVCGEAVALNWMCDIAAARAEREGEIRFSAALVVLGIVLLVGNPWVVWTTSFDVHLEPFATLFVLCAARSLYTGRRRGWIWVLLAFSVGSVGASYLFALGLSAVLVGRRFWRRGTGLAALGVVWVLFLQAIHGAQAAGVLEYNYLYTGKWGGKLAKFLSGTNIAEHALEHPSRIFVALWHNKVNLWANISPGGIIGLVWLPLLIPALLISAEGGLSIPLFSRPGFQSIALAALVALGTVALLAAIPVGNRRRRRWALACAVGLLSLNALAWSAVWLPQVSKTWLDTDSGAAAVLGRLRQRMGPADEVLASQGVIGGFADRRDAFILDPHSMAVPIHSRTVWIVVTPTQGIESNNAHGFNAEMQTFNANPRMHLVVASHGVWAYRYNPPPGQRLLKISFTSATPEPAWTLPGAAGTTVMAGPRAQWHVASTGKPGYVIDRSLWREPSGRYRATAAVSVMGTGPATARLELWDDDTNTLLGRTVLHNTHGVKEASVVADLAVAAPPREASGWGLWRATPVVPNGDSLEVRIWTPGGADRVRVYGVSLQRLSG